MTMLNESQVRTIMRTKLQKLSNLPNISWENRPFLPPDVTTDVGPVVLWIQEHQRTLDETQSAIGMIQTIGETLYSVYTPKGRGTKEADDLSKSIAESFEPTQSLTGINETIVIEHTERHPYRVDPDLPAWVFKTVSIRWRAFNPTS